MENKGLLNLDRVSAVSRAAQYGQKIVRTNEIIDAYLYRISKRFDWEKITGFKIDPKNTIDVNFPKKYTLDSGKLVEIETRVTDDVNLRGVFEPITNKVTINIRPLSNNYKLLSIIPLSGGTPEEYIALVHELVHAVQYDQAEKIKVNFSQILQQIFNRNQMGLNAILTFAMEAQAFTAMSFAGDYSGVDYLKPKILAEALSKYKDISQVMSAEDLNRLSALILDVLLLLYADGIKHNEIAEVIMNTRVNTNVFRKPNPRNYISELELLAKSKGLRMAEAIDARMHIEKEKATRQENMHEILLDTIEKIQI